MLVSNSHSLLAHPSMVNWVFGPERSVRQQPRLVVSEDDIFEWQIDVPGVMADGLELEVEGRQVRLKTERKYGEQSEHNHLRWVLPKTADSETLSADLSHGVLTLSVRKLSSAQARKVAISTAEAA